MKEKPNFLLLNVKKNLSAFSGYLRSGPNIFSIALCIITIIVVISGENNEPARDISDYEAGKVADRDVIASTSISYLDRETTDLRGVLTVIDIEKGEKIIRKGFIITEAEMDALRALHLSL
jgi:membrane-associated HD superfamily phosphohydrolase